jgi:RNA 2',3'-cyclic 3'-phosphodiesterase
MSRSRIFIAVDINEAVRKRVTALQEKLGRSAPGVRWVEPASIHVTLLFLGEVSDLEVVSVCRSVDEQTRNVAPFSLAFAGLGAFPNPRRPKTLWVDVKQGAKEMLQLHDDLEGPLLELGCHRREDRAYKPHLTLGRLSQEDRDGAWAPILKSHADWEGGATHVEEVLVMSSELRRDGPVYSVMGRAKLRGISEVEEVE